MGKRSASDENVGRRKPRLQLIRPSGDDIERRNAEYLPQSSGTIIFYVYLKIMYILIYF